MHGSEYEQDAATFWEDRYRGQSQTWSGRPNAALVREVAGLEPGRALDLGSGEGGDAIWLAQQGWTVTAADISPSALALGARNSEVAGVGERIRWFEVDLAGWQPSGSYDLVSAQFLHSPVELPREDILRRAASAVTSGGLLLIVGHADFPPWSSHPRDGVVLPTADEVLASLELAPEAWTVVTSAGVERATTGPDGSSATLVDSVLSVRRQE